MSKYFIKTYGCQMNKGDSDRLSGILESSGYTECQDPKEADIILVNTCVVRQNAEDKAAWYIQSLKGAKKKKPNLLIGICGCLVTSPTFNAKKTFPHVDIFIPPGQPEVLAEYLDVESRKLKVEHRKDGGGELTAWISIMEGCDNFCSYCIVPYTRGREKSRPMQEILDEIKQLDFNHVKEIYLLGQNVNSYKFGLANLLKEIDDLVARCPLPVTRIRFMTSHPKDMSDEIINAVTELPHVVKEFHLPLQAGDDAILKMMNRGYTVDHYRNLVNKIRSVLPKADISTDIMVGFPGETEEQFQNLLNLVSELKFSMVNMFAYSPRTGTPAAKMDQVPDKIKQERLQRLIVLVRSVVNSSFT